MNTNICRAAGSLTLSGLALCASKGVRRYPQWTQPSNVASDVAGVLRESAAMYQGHYMASKTFWCNARPYGVAELLDIASDVEAGGADMRWVYLRAQMVSSSVTSHPLFNGLHAQVADMFTDEDRAEQTARWDAMAEAQYAREQDEFANRCKTVLYYEEDYSGMPATLCSLS